MPVTQGMASSSALPVTSSMAPPITPAKKASPHRALEERTSQTPIVPQHSNCCHQGGDSYHCCFESPQCRTVSQAPRWPSLKAGPSRQPAPCFVCPLLATGQTSRFSACVLAHSFADHHTAALPALRLLSSSQLEMHDASASASSTVFLPSSTVSISSASSETRLIVSFFRFPTPVASVLSVKPLVLQARSQRSLRPMSQRSSLPSLKSGFVLRPLRSGGVSCSVTKLGGGMASSSLTSCWLDTTHHAIKD